VRGGGNNFGVVTSFLFKACPVSTVYGGPIFWPMDKGAELLRWWRDFILKAPEDINGWFGFATVPPVQMFPELRAPRQGEKEVRPDQPVPGEPEHQTRVAVPDPAEGRDRKRGLGEGSSVTRSLHRGEFT